MNKDSHHKKPLHIVDTACRHYLVSRRCAERDPTVIRARVLSPSVSRNCFSPCGVHAGRARQPEPQRLLPYYHYLAACGKLMQSTPLTILFRPTPTTTPTYRREAWRDLSPGRPAVALDGKTIGQKWVMGLP